MAENRIQSFTTQASKILEYLHKEYSKLQTGRANAAMVEHVLVDAYGQKQELRSVAGISIQDARTIVIQPWDNGILNQVDAALSTLNLGTNPMNDGSVIRVSLPTMTEERRKELVKVVHTLAEDARISVRQQRQELLDKIKEEKDEDVRYTLQDELDKAVKSTNEAIEELRDNKEKEVMTV